MPGGAAWPLPCAGWFRVSPAVSWDMSDPIASLKCFRPQATWVRSRRIISHLAARLKPRAMHAKWQTDAVTPMLLAHVDARHDCIDRKQEQEGLHRLMRNGHSRRT